MTSPTPTVRKLGGPGTPGVLTIGAVGAPLDFSGRCTSVKITWKVDTEDDEYVLSGEVLAGDRTYSATLEATVKQDDLTVGGLVEYSWSHKGQQVPFTFTPYDNGRAITGQLIVDPLDVGGDVNMKNTADLSWACVGEPTLIDDLS